MSVKLYDASGALLRNKKDIKDPRDYKRFSRNDVDKIVASVLNDSIIAKNTLQSMLWHVIVQYKGIDGIVDIDNEDIVNNVVPNVDMQKTESGVRLVAMPLPADDIKL